MKVSQKLRKTIFEIIEPIFPAVRDSLTSLGILKHKGRQKYPLGFLVRNKTVEDLKTYLQTLGFHKNRIAWLDEGEILGMRLLDGFDYCYHVRLFADGEIKGHYERTVESNPFAHFFEIGMQAKTEMFMNFLKPMLEPKQEFQTQPAKVND